MWYFVSCLAIVDNVFITCAISEVVRKVSNPLFSGLFVGYWLSIFTSNPGFFGPISNKCRVVDLPENWGFWKFPLYFWGNSWLYQQFCMVLDQNSKILQKIFIYFRKSCRNFESLEKNSWVIVFSPRVLERMSKQKTCSNPKISKHSLYTGDEKKIVSLNKNDWSKNETTVDCFWKLQTNEI